MEKENKTLDTERSENIDTLSLFKENYQENKQGFNVTSNLKWENI